MIFRILACNDGFLIYGGEKKALQFWHVRIKSTKLFESTMDIKDEDFTLNSFILSNIYYNKGKYGVKKSEICVLSLMQRSFSFCVLKLRWSGRILYRSLTIPTLRKVR